MGSQGFLAAAADQTSLWMVTMQSSRWVDEFALLEVPTVLQCVIVHNWHAQLLFWCWHLSCPFCKHFDPIADDMHLPFWSVQLGARTNTHRDTCTCTQAHKHTQTLNTQILHAQTYTCTCAQLACTTHTHTYTHMQHMHAHATHIHWCTCHCVYCLLLCACHYWMCHCGLLLAIVMLFVARLLFAAWHYWMCQWWVLLAIVVVWTHEDQCQQTMLVNIESVFFYKASTWHGSWPKLATANSMT